MVFCLKTPWPCRSRKKAWAVSVWMGRLVWLKLSKLMPKAAKESRMDAWLRSTSSLGLMPSRSAVRVMGTPYSSEPQMYRTSSPRRRRKRTKMSAGR